MKSTSILAAVILVTATLGCSPPSSPSKDSDMGAQPDTSGDGLACMRNCFCPCGSYSIPCNSGAFCTCSCPDDGGADLAGSDASTDDDASDLEDTGTDVPFRALLFSRTEGFRHGSIPDAIAAIEALGSTHDFDVETTEDPALFNDDYLARFDVIVFLMTTGDVLDGPQEDAMQRFVQSGGGWVGIHSASDTEYDWTWYGELVGAYFSDHPSIQDAAIDVEDATHPSTSHLPARWERRDEWYNFATNPRPEVHVLATLDETTYDGGSM
ncbi:MAG: ThuA domain-containing protein, partial [Halobacteriales archaeon]|nr:ThuA domain-containing protein [Halobacteriales archaeon]